MTSRVHHMGEQVVHITLSWHGAQPSLPAWPDQPASQLDDSITPSFWDPSHPLSPLAPTGTPREESPVLMLRAGDLQCPQAKFPVPRSCVRKRMCVRAFLPSAVPGCRLRMAGRDCDDTGRYPSPISRV